MQLGSASDGSRGAARAGQRLISTLALAACLVAVGGRPAVAQCEGDCDGSQSVTINELISAVRIALGGAPVNDCTAADLDQSGDVTINELVAAVSRALQGCAGELDEDLLRGSARASVEPIIRIIDLGSASVGGSSEIAGARAARAIARPAGISGCQTFDCFAFGGEITGSEEVCCNGDLYTLNASTCTFEDDDGTLISREGFFALRSDAQDCSGAFPPAGTNFESEFDGFSLELIDTETFAYVLLFADQVESFEAESGGCSIDQPDSIGLGLRGDGTRFISGVQRTVISDDQGDVVFDQQSAADVSIDVSSSLESEGCAVEARLNGVLTSNDFNAGVDFTAEYSEFAVSQLPTDDGLLLGLDGTVSTDCVGDVTVQTLEPLRLPAGAECPTGGSLEALVSGGSATVNYTASGGVELDYGSDGSIDDTFDSCEELTSDTCTGPSGGLCAPCVGPDSCEDPLGCFACAMNCESDILRCARSDEFVTCEDGVY